jgi:fatty-acyl-CoA synthase
MRATMQDVPLTLTAILAGIDVSFGGSVVTTYTGPDEKPRAATYTEVAARAAQLANGLASLGIAPGDRVATFMWNTQEHLETYLAVPCSGAVLH